MSPSNKKENSIKTISRNRRAHLRFTILESLEAGIVLHGYEVKSLREGKAQIEDGLVRIQNGEIFLMNAHIAPYAHLAHADYNPTRTRKLLLHKTEINRLYNKMQLKDFTLVPLEVYFKNGKAKLAIGLAKGKKREDRREEIKKREVEREIRRKYKA
ncbi:MAG: SsrA-binding protein SmpB [Elusimicrobia bacterium]|nr:SsrA-binding protein SmpB [Elusimicrobiota bacterium]